MRCQTQISQLTVQCFLPPPSYLKSILLSNRKFHRQSIPESVGRHNSATTLCQICTGVTVKCYPEHSLNKTGYSLGLSKDIKLRISTLYYTLCKIVHSKICGSESIVTLKPNLDLSDENDEKALLRKGQYLEILYAQHNHSSIRIVTNEQFLWTRYKRLINLDNISSKAWEDGNPRLINYLLILSWLRDYEVGYTRTCNPNTDQRYKSYVDIVSIDVVELRLV